MLKIEAVKLSDNEENQQKTIQNRLGELQRNNRTLHEQVDILQIESKSHKSPWFKNPSVLVSLLAVLVTVILTSYNIHQQNKDMTVQDIKEKQSNVRAAITKLVEAQKENIKLAKVTNINEREQLDLLINSQRQVLIEDAKAMVDELGTDASTNSLLFLGFELQKDADFEIAHRYFERALLSARGDLSDQVVALRSLANFRMLLNTGFNDYEKGRKYWQQAVDIQKNQKDEYSLFLLGNTYLNWGNAENILGNKEIAVKLLTQSEKTFELMDIRNPMREQAIQRNNRILKYVLEPTAQFTSAQLTGDWRLKYFNNNNVTGNIQIASNPTNHSLYVIGELLDRNGVVIQKFNGQALLNGSGTLRIDWQGAKIGVRGIEQLQGSMTLKNVGTDDFEGTESVLGRIITKVNFSRV